MQKLVLHVSIITHKCGLEEVSYICMFVCMHSCSGHNNYTKSMMWSLCMSKLGKPPIHGTAILCGNLLSRHLTNQCPVEVSDYPWLLSICQLISGMALNCITILDRLIRS